MSIKKNKEDNRTLGQMLFKERPVTIDVGLATALGLETATFLQQCHYWLEGGKEQMRYGKVVKSFKDNVIWNYNTQDEWLKQLPFLSKSTLKRIIGNLEFAGILISTDKYEYNRSSRRRWFTINYPLLELIDKTYYKVCCEMRSKLKDKKAESNEIKEQFYVRYIQNSMAQVQNELADEINVSEIPIVKNEKAWEACYGKQVQSELPYEIKQVQSELPYEIEQVQSELVEKSNLNRSIYKEITLQEEEEEIYNYNSSCKKLIQQVPEITEFHTLSLILGRLKVPDLEKFELFKGIFERFAFFDDEAKKMVNLQIERTAQKRKSEKGLYDYNKYFLNGLDQQIKNSKLTEFKKLPTRQEGFIEFKEFLEQQLKQNKITHTEYVERLINARKAYDMQAEKEATLFTSGLYS